MGKAVQYHEVYADYAGWEQSTPRLTCRTCGDKTLLANRTMSQDDWDDLVDKFNTEHPSLGTHYSKYPIDTHAPIPKPRKHQRRS